METRKRVGILTFHSSRNYGAVLQAYGLSKMLREYGMDAEVIDYRCPKIEDGLRLWNGTQDGFLYAMRQMVYRGIKKYSFQWWIARYLPESERHNVSANDMAALMENYDVVIVGSDQVWNGKITGDDDIYYLMGIGDRIKKIAYAVSVGDSGTLPAGRKDCVKAFHAVSVRERNMQDKFREWGVEAEVCCDPSFFLSDEELYALSDRCCQRKRYVFLFRIQNSEVLYDAAKKYADDRGVRLVSNKADMRFLMHCSPSDYLSWIRHAECVFTDSFHATLFSIRFHKLFFSDIRKQEGELARNERVLHLLGMLGLEECILNWDDPKQAGRDAGLAGKYMGIDEKIQIIREQSMQWLLDAIDEDIG